MMGEAKRRGTPTQRKEAAIKRNKKIAKHYDIRYEELTRRQITNMNNNYALLKAKQQAEVTGPPLPEDGK